MEPFRGDNPTPWPTADMELFVGDLPDWEHNAYMHGDPDSWSVIAEGFKMGSDRLVGRVMETHTDQDFLVFPIVFGYRHYVELNLKGSWVYLRRLDSSLGTVHHNHFIRQLWRRLRPEVERFVTGEPPDDIEHVENVILQLDKVDPGSFDFRYPVSKKGETLGRKAGVRINLRHLKEQIDALDTWFMGLYGYLDHLIESRP